MESREKVKERVLTFGNTYLKTCRHGSTYLPKHTQEKHQSSIIKSKNSDCGPATGAVTSENDSSPYKYTIKIFANISHAY